MREVTRTELLKYEFSLEEIQQHAQNLARANQQANQLEAEKKQVASDYKGRIEAKQSEIMALSNSLAMGYEMRRTECSVIYNSPRSGEKSVVRKDTGEIVRVERMSMEEMQDVFPFEPQPEEKSDGALATLHGEAPLEEQMFGFTGKVTRMAVRVFRTRKGWHWMYGMTDGSSNASSVSSESSVPLKEEAIRAGAQALHDAVQMAWRRNGKQLSAERKADALHCMDWASRMVADPTLAADFCAEPEITAPQISAPEDDAADAAGAE